MKRSHMAVVVAVVGLALLAVDGWAGWFGSSQSDRSDQQLAKLLGMDRSFTATAAVSVRNQKGAEVSAASVQWAVLAGKVRMDIDLTRTKSAGNSAQAMADMAGLGMDRIVSIIRPDLKVTWVVCPGLKGYWEKPMGDKTTTNAPPQLTKTELEKETIDGHPCVKSKVVMTEANGDQSAMLVWEAKDLHDFPLQTQMQEGKETVITRFQDIKPAKPSASLFELPAGLKQYRSMQEMMMSGMQQMMQGGGE